MSESEVSEVVIDILIGLLLERRFVDEGAVEGARSRGPVPDARIRTTSCVLERSPPQPSEGAGLDRG